MRSDVLRVQWVLLPCGTALLLCCAWRCSVGADSGNLNPALAAALPNLRALPDMRGAATGAAWLGEFLDH